MDETYRKLLRVYDTEMRKELDTATFLKTLDTLHMVRLQLSSSPSPSSDARGRC